MHQYELAVRARQDLESIYEYTYLRNHGAARRQLTKFIDFFYLLASEPGMGRDCSQLRKGWRCYPFENFMIYYRVTAQGIRVMRVLHGARDLTDILGPKT